MTILKTTTAIALFTVLGAMALPAQAQDSMMKDSMEKTTMTEEAMAKDSMMKDAMAKEAMAKESMMEDSMIKATMAKDAMVKDHMSEPSMMKKDAMVKDAMVKDAMMKKSSAPVRFEKKSFRVRGTYSVVEENGQTLIRLSEDFKTKAGPDLKIFLSPQNSQSVSGATAVNGSVLLGALKSNKGGSDYIIPAGVTLSDFQSVLVHCEAYSKLWAAGDLT